MFKIPGIGVQLPPESPFNFRRNRRSRWAGIRKHLGKKRLDALEPADLAQFRRLLDAEREADKAISASTIHKTMTALGTMLRWFYKEGLMKQDLSRAISAPGEENVSYRPFTVAEWCRIKETIEEGDFPSWLWPMVEFTLLTGNRRQETLSLKWSAVRDGFLVIPQGKTGKEKVLPISAPAGAILEAQRSSALVHRDGYVFLDDDGQPINGNWCSKLFLRVLRNAKVEDLPESRASLHSVRTTAATILGEAHHPSYMIAAYLGHSRRQKQTWIYIQTEAAALSPLAETIARWMEQEPAKESISSDGKLQ